MPAAITAAEMTTPSVESTTTGSMSCRSSRQRILSAASNRSGGRMISKMKECVSIAPGSSPTTARPIPVTTSPTVYGRCMRRAMIATITATPRTLMV